MLENSVTASVESVVPSLCWNSSVSCVYSTSGRTVNVHISSCETSSGVTQQMHSAMFPAVCDTDMKTKSKTKRRINISSGVVFQCFPRSKQG